MKFENSENILTIHLEDRLDSSNADLIDKKINEIIDGEKFEKLILDFSGLRYLSSAGLRVILKIKHKVENLSIIDVSLEVYDTLSMTGFTELIDIKKALRKMDVTNAEVVGDGYFSTVYKINKDTIIKVFNRTSDPNQIERELKLAKEAFILGIPTAISFDIVKVGEKLGVCFEMLDCMSLKEAVKKHPEKSKEYLDKYSQLLKHINSTECTSSFIPKIKDFYLQKVEVIKPFIGDKYYKKAKHIIENIEERSTFVHGDCHFKNIMIQNGEFLLIDMDTLSVGHPIFELAQIYAPYVAFEQDDPGNCQRFLGIPAEDAKKLYEATVTKYLGKDDQVIKEKIQLVAYIHMVWWNRINEPDNNVRLEGCKGRLLSLLDKYDDVNF